MWKRKNLPLICFRVCYILEPPAGRGPARSPPLDSSGSASLIIVVPLQQQHGQVLAAAGSGRSFFVRWLGYF
ncbi:hypothetical protein EJB05_11542, partial [Eragrostis curvula]